MLKTTAEPTPVQEAPPNNNDKYTALLEKQVAQLEKINAFQEEKIKGLEREIAKLKKQTKSPISAPTVAK